MRGLGLASCGASQQVVPVQCEAADGRLGADAAMGSVLRLPGATRDHAHTPSDFRVPIRRMAANGFPREEAVACGRESRLGKLKPWQRVKAGASGLDPGWARRPGPRHLPFHRSRVGPESTPKLRGPSAGMRKKSGRCGRTRPDVLSHGRGAPPAARLAVRPAKA
jgi:hypothetical protein